ncbi:MAG: arginine N-succinyltransferase [Bacteriovoracia bacterium]
MIVLREAGEKDLEALERLSSIAAEKHPGFLNLQSDREQWKEKIGRSVQTFSDSISDKMLGKYLFVAEDVSKSPSVVVGCSMIASQHGTPESPHFFFEVGTENKYSQTISTGFIHGTLKLRYDTDGPTEIGGLLVDPEYRNFKERIGRQISFVRFLYMGMHKSKFKRRVLAELLPPLTKKGKSPLWEAVGRRFTNMDYTEADILSSKNKEFILSLFPSGKIYVTFLPAEARNAIGKVSKDTEPVMHMLKKAGFQYRDQVDPFDGGPHLIANIDEIIPMRKIRASMYGGEDAEKNKSPDVVAGLVTVKNKGDRKFSSVSVSAVFSGDKIYFARDAAEYCGISLSEPVVFMPFY